MARRCEACGKGPMVGHHVSHSNVKTKRRMLPNLQSVRVPDGGNTKRVKVCTSCLKAGKLTATKK